MAYIYKHLPEEWWMGSEVDARTAIFCADYYCAL